MDIWARFGLAVLVFPIVIGPGTPADADQAWTLWGIQTRYEAAGAVVWDDAWTYFDTFDSRALCEKALGDQTASKDVRPNPAPEGGILAATFRCFPVGMVPRMEPPINPRLREKAMSSKGRSHPSGPSGPVRFKDDEGVWHWVNSIDEVPQKYRAGVIGGPVPKAH